MTPTEKLPTINIKGKEYTMVKDRILFFNSEYPQGSIQTQLLSDPNADRVVVKAVVTPDHMNPARVFIDHAQEVVGQGEVNRTSALENASTSAVGRALAFMGIGVLETIASADEVRKAQNRPLQPFAKQINTVAQTEKVVAQVSKATSFPYGANDPLPAALYNDAKVEAAPDTMSEEISKLADELEQIEVLATERNTQIQNRLQELTKSKVLDRRKLSLFLDRQHGGKKAFDVPAKQWEDTMSKIESAVQAGEEAVKTLLKG